MFWGEGPFVFALMLLYTIISYSVFRGKVASLPPTTETARFEDAGCDYQAAAQQRGGVRCETAERDNARGGPTVLTVRSGGPRMAAQ
jgi:hypothetical protein